MTCSFFALPCFAQAPLRFAPSILLSCLFFCVLTSSGCGDANDKVAFENIELNYASEVAPYLSGFTAGVVSRQSRVMVQFAKEVISEDQVGSAFDSKEILTIQPAIEGVATWLDERTLEFNPASMLQSATTFTATLDLSHFYADIPEELALFQFQFRVAQTSYAITHQPLKATANQQVATQSLSGTITASDFETPANVERMVTVTYRNGAMPVKWTHAEDGRTHSYTIEDIKRQDTAGELVFSWDASFLNANFKGERKIMVPPSQSFSFVRAEAHLQPDRHVQVYFSDPIQANQNLDGLLRLADYEVRFVVDGNLVKLYPASTTNTFTGTLSLDVETGIKNVMGARIETSKTVEVVFNEIQPSVQLTGNGTIIPVTEHIPFTFKAVNLSAVNVEIKKIGEDNLVQFFQVNALPGTREMYRVGQSVETKRIDLPAEKESELKQWKTYAIALNDVIEPAPGAIYRISISYKKEDSLYPCASDNVTTENLSAEGNRYYDEYDQDYQRDRKDPCKDAYFHNRSVARNVLASDLGLIAKRSAADELVVAATDLHTTEPLANVKLELYDMSQERINTVSTNEEGVAKVNFSRMPFLVVASLGEQRGYLKLQDGQALSLSRFDVSGSQAQAGLRGFVYGERGVWRPGDLIHLTFVLDDAESPLPKEHPVIFELLNPQGQVVDRMVKKESLNGFYAFTTSTKSDAPTGNYTAKIIVGGTSFTKTIKVETIMPNRLKIKLDFDVPYITSEPADKEAELAVTWLHGAVAKNLTADIEATLTPKATSFENYKGYSFDDPGRPYAQHVESVFKAPVDEQGKASFPVKLAANDNAPGMLRATFLTKVFEPGGAFSIDQFSHTYHPYSQYVGLRVPLNQRRRARLMQDQDNAIEIVTVDQMGRPVSKKDVTVFLYRVSWRWWWDRSSRESINYNTREFTAPIAADTIATDKNGIGKAIIRADHTHWGRYLLRACDTGGHCSGTFVYMDWRGKYGRGGTQPGGETMLTFSADKEVYNVGDKVTLSIPTPAQGRALISLESGKEVLSTHWIDAERGTTTFTFEATPEMAPNIYANVSLLQPHAQTANDLPIRLYGVIPIMVNDDGSRLKPEIQMADVIRPESSVDIKVSEENGRPMTYTVAVVDEGLLDLTRFKTPNPWDHFFARQALSTKTWDVFDHVVGASSLEYQSLLGIGGGADDEEEEMGVSKVNRFRPVVKHLGPFELAAGKTAAHSIQMPLYVGAVRTMVVAGDLTADNIAFGAIEKATPVRKPLMLLGTLPRVLGPEEEVDFYLSVFAMEDNMGDVDLTVEVNDLIELTGTPQKVVKFDQAGEEVVTFPMKMKERAGTASIRAIARSGNETAEYNFDIEIRHPNSEIAVVEHHSIKSGETQTFTPELFGLAGTNSGVLEVSAIEPLNLEKRLRYLIRYPHGCIEQTTSSVFPQLYLSELMKLDAQKQERIERNVKIAISKLGGFQLPSGGFSYWPGQNGATDWGTSYVGHFLITAKSLGYVLPDGMLQDWVRYQTKAANHWKRDQNTQSELTQAYRLYLLALADKAQLGAMNRFREGLFKNVTARWLLAAAYHQIGQQEVAVSISKSLGWNIRAYKELSYTYGSTLRDQALILDAMTQMESITESDSLVSSISKSLASGKWMSTQTTAFSLLAMGHYAHLLENEMHVIYGFEKNAPVDLTIDRSIHQIDMGLEDDVAETMTVTNRSEVPLFITTTVQGKPPLGEESDISNGITLSVVYKDMDNKIIDPARLAQGTDFYVEVTVQNPDNRRLLSDLALTHIIPSGWEIHNDRLFGQQASKYAKPTHQDIRDDRVLSYFDLSGKQKKTFRLLLNASYRGHFYLPPIQVSAMYDEELTAQQKGQWVEVY